MQVIISLLLDFSYRCCQSYKYSSPSPPSAHSHWIITTLLEPYNQQLSGYVSQICISLLKSKIARNLHLCVTWIIQSHHIYNCTAFLFHKHIFSLSNTLRCSIVRTLWTKLMEFPLIKITSPELLFSLHPILDHYLYYAHSTTLQVLYHSFFPLTCVEL